MWMVALNQVRHRSYWGPAGDGGAMMLGTGWDGGVEAGQMVGENSHPLSPGQGEMNDGETMLRLPV